MEHDFHRQLKADATRFLRGEGWTAFQEFALPDRKIADIFASRMSGKILIVEVKSTLKDYLVLEAYLKYSKYCDAFYVAAPACELADYAFNAPLLAWEQLSDRPGLLALEAGRVRVIRQACPLTIPPQMRTELLHHFNKTRLSGRTAAFPR